MEHPMPEVAVHDVPLPLSDTRPALLSWCFLLVLNAQDQTKVDEDILKNQGANTFLIES